MYGNIHYKLHTVEVMQYKACAQPQDDEGMGSMMGWFYGFKLHIVINDRDEIIQWTLTPGNVDDREPLKDKDFTHRLFGKIFVDRGYISQELFKRLFIDGIHLVTKLKMNMKNSPHEHA